MAREALEIIKEAEEQAWHTVEQAHAEAQRLISDAKKRAEDEARAADETVKSRIGAAREAAGEEARARRVQFEAETEQMARELTLALEAKREAAVRAATNIIVGN